MCWEALRVFIEYVSPFCRRRQWWIKGDRDRGSWTLGPVLIKLISALKFETLWMICSRGVRSEGPTLLWTGLSRRIFLPRSFAQTEWCRDLKARFLRPRVIHLFHASSLGVWISLTRLLPGWVSHYTKPGGDWVRVCKCVPVLSLFTPWVHCVFCWSCLWKQTSLGLSSSLILTAWVTLEKRCHLSGPHLPHL